MSRECVTIPSSDNDDIQVIENSPIIKEAEAQCSFNGTTSEERRRVPLQPAVTGKEIFAEFLGKCKLVDSSGDMELAIQKLWKRFNQAEDTYTSSIVFIELVKEAMKNVQSEPYYQLKMVADELNHNKKITTKSKVREVLPSTSAMVVDNAENEIDPKTALHLKKLEKTLVTLHKRIQRLESNEVDFNSSDDENSSYIQVSRYKERLCQVYHKICELQKKDPHAERPLRKHIKFSGTKISAVDKAIEKFYNDRKEFPDYRDILTVVQKANEVKKLNLHPREIESLALQAFQEFGKTLKKWRVYDDVEVFNSYTASHDEEDPASRDEELKSKLEENKKKYGNRIDEVIDKYAMKQTEENIQPEVVKSDAQSEESEEEEEEDPESDCRSRSSILEWKSISLSDSDDERYPECRVVLTDVRFTAEGKKYLKSLEEDSNKTAEPVPSTSKQAVINEEKSLPPWLNRKRRLSENSEPSTSKKSKTFNDVEPVPSTSKQSVFVVLENYRHVLEKDQLDGISPPQTSNQPNPGAKLPEYSEPMPVDNDCDVIEVVSDSCEKVDENDEDRVHDSDKKPNSVSKNIDSIDICTEESEDQNQNKDQQHIEFVSVGVCVDETDSEVNLADFSASSPSKCTVETHQNDQSESTDVAAAQSEEIISLDICTDDSEAKAKANDPDDEREVIGADKPKPEDLPKETRKIEEKVEEAKNSNDDNENDEIMIIDEIIKTPQKDNQSKIDDVIDVEEIADSPQKPKKLAQVTLGAVNLTQIIRNMQFNKNASSTSTQQKAMPIPSTSQLSIRRIDPRIGNSSTGKELVLNNQQGTSNQNQHRSLAISNTRNNKNSNTHNVRQGNAANVNQRKPLNHNQFLTGNARNLPHYFANNRNITLQPTQTSMQKRQFTTHTIQQQKFNKRTNSVVTTKQITTVVQESVMRVDSSQLPGNFNNSFQVFGQRTRMVNRRVQQVQRSTRCGFSNSSEDVITLD